MTENLHTKLFNINTIKYVEAKQCEYKRDEMLTLF